MNAWLSYNKYSRKEKLKEISMDLQQKTKSKT